MKRIVLFLMATAMLLACMLPMGVFADNKVRLLSGTQVYQAFENSENSVAEVFKSSNGASLPYRLYVPDDYDPNKKYPLVLFFHGAGERGTDNKAQISAGSVMQRLLVESEQKKFPCLILAPQCPGDSQWVLSDWGPGVYNHNTMQTPVSPYMAAAEELLAKVVADYSVDQSRLYVTGMSMGGFGTWDIISRNPDMFAAAFPVCGGVDETYLDALQGVPIWTFHNNGDTIVSSAGTKKAYDILKDAGGITYTEFKSTAHDAWTEAYSTELLLNWVFTKIANSKVTYPEVEHVSFQGPDKVTRGTALTFTYTADEGYCVTSLTVDGIEMELSDDQSGRITIAEYIGGEIAVTVEKAQDPVDPGDQTVDDLDPEPGVDNDGVPTWAIVLIIIAAVVSVGVVVLLVIKMKKK